MSRQNDADIRDTLQIFKWAKQLKELYLSSGSAHGTKLFGTECRQDLIERIIAFIERYTPLL